MSRRIKKVLITGSSGLVGSEAAIFFDQKGWAIFGMDNNMRRDFFGPDGDTTRNLRNLRKITKRFEHHQIDIRNRKKVWELVKKVKPDLIIHCAGQPSHDLASQRPFDDFDVNAVGTMNLLESVRNFCKDSPFLFMSTNKVYGDVPNEIPLIELESRYDYARSEDWDGVDETCRMDRNLHSLFGASKAGADIMVQEYGHYFQMPTVSLRASCITGSRHAGAEFHGFLAYMARCVNEDRIYCIYGYKGKQVRDNIHAFDLCTLFLAFYEDPKCGAVYNLGGGRENSISILEAIERFYHLTRKRLRTSYRETNRKGDHICYMTNLNKLKKDFPGWEVTKNLEDIFTDFFKKEFRLGVPAGIK